MPKHSHTAARSAQESRQPRPRGSGASSDPACPQTWMSDTPSADAALQLDPSVPHAARVYGYWLGGKDHYPADRKVAEEVIRRRPQVVAGARANRAFLARVVRYLAADCGIRQFLDIGTGLPAPASTHQVAQAVVPDSRIVYVDNDPLVLAHARALLTSTREGSCDYLDADLRDTLPSWPGRLGRWISASPPQYCYWRYCISSPTPTIRLGSWPPWPAS
jgi:hypothetical protein